MVLSDLCAICASHSEKPKYRCPRCKTQTCSLPCYQRHQQRASCSGRRDPAIYVKKSQWATPAGIDHDYNYLKDVERNIDDASQSAHQGGIGAQARASKGVSQARQPESTLTKYLRRNNITVDHAPPGMSRQKTNQTRTTKAGNVMWTIEWIDGSGQRDVQNDCLESASLHKIYSARQKEKRNAEKKITNSRETLQTNQRGVKRKRETVEKETQQNPDDTFHRQEEEFLQDLKSVECSNAHDRECSKEQGGVNSPGQSAELAESTAKSATSRDSLSGEDISFAQATKEGVLPAESERTPASSTSPPIQEHDDDHFPSGRSSSPVQFIVDAKDKPAPPLKLESPIVSQQVASPQHALEDSSDLHFYLLKPGTRSASHILIPVKPEATLTESLQNQTVQEYPTIYVLPCAPQALPTDFLLVTEYMKTISREENKPEPQPKVDTAANQVPLGTKRQNQAEHVGELDAKSILEMLRKDTTV